ncbi:MAG: PDZ domain-containing protein, partial [Campylobacter sp.]|nr:PDZ domain-containing protein [Campylobacter sp.]
KDQKEVYKNTEGALIMGVEKDLPADKAGIKRGDLITKVDGKTIKNSNDLKNLIGSMPPNKTIEVEFERDKSMKTAKIKLDSMSGDEKSSGAKGGSAIDGLKLSNLNDELRQKYRLDSDINGILVTDVENDSKADEFGFKVGDVIIQIGQKDVKNIEDFNKLVKDYKGQKTLVWVIRNRIPQGLVIK